MRVAWAIVLACTAGQAPDKDGLVLVQQQSGASVWVKRPAGEPLSIGLTEKLTLSILVVGTPILEVELGETPTAQDGWLLEAAGKPRVQADSGEKVSRWEQIYHATPLKPGPNPLKLPGLKWTENDGPEQSAAFAPLAFNVTTRITRVDVSELRERLEIEEVPAPAETPAVWWPWLLALVPALAVAGLAVAMRNWRRPSPVSARLTALRALGELEKQLASDGVSLAEWQAGLADVLRQFLEQQYAWPATRRTTAEFLADASLPLLPEQTALLAEILRHCDLAKFAGQAFGPDEARKSAQLARQVVEQPSPLVIR
jgi:hypothetical protein